MAKAKLVGARTIVEVAPVPVVVPLCGLFEALSVTTTVPVRVPVTVGTNDTLIAQLAAAANEVPQALV
ncbi:MAG TPA: hypothetical protein VKJ01_16020 [Candidatus Solibacter sp.]|nr:hypothetical protein [Candidatus Solibacter sp.]